MDDISTGISAFRAMIEALRGMLALSKEVKDAIPEGTPQKEAFEQAVKEFNASAEQFKVQLAKEWGYPLCQCSFPPTIMLRTFYEQPPNACDHYACPACGLEETVYR